MFWACLVSDKLCSRGSGLWLPKPGDHKGMPLLPHKISAQTGRPQGDAPAATQNLSKPNLGRGDPEGEGAPLTELAGNGNVAFIDGE
jgi:hypothetical protein